MKKIIISVILVALFLTGCQSKDDESEKLKIMTTNFPTFDFVRAITKDVDVEINMLIKPGEDIHHFEPTPKDIININESDLFIYIGGESDEWVNNILKGLDNKDLKVLKLMNYVNLYHEGKSEGMQEEEDDHEHNHDHEHGDESEETFDEHIWTSPVNAIKILEVIKDKIVEIDKDNKEKYEKNYSAYIEKIKEIDTKIRDVVKNGKRRLLVFADRFPLTYFVKEYNLDFYGAFPGCSHENEASSKTVAFLIDKVKENKVPVVFHLELSNKKTATLIANETKTKLREIHSAHNVSIDDFNKGITYVDIMNKNIEVLKEALS